MATKLFKEVWWYLSEGWVRAFARRVEDVTVYANVYRPVNKIKDTPISGDALAWYRKEWRKYGDY